MVMRKMKKKINLNSEISFLYLIKICFKYFFHVFLCIQNEIFNCVITNMFLRMSLPLSLRLPSCSSDSDCKLSATLFCSTWRNTYLIWNMNYVIRYYVRDLDLWDLYFIPHLVVVPLPYMYQGSVRIAFSIFSQISFYFFLFR